MIRKLPGAASRGPAMFARLRGFAIHPEEPATAANEEEEVRVVPDDSSTTTTSNNPAQQH